MAVNETIPSLGVAGRWPAALPLPPYSGRPRGLVQVLARLAQLVAPVVILFFTLVLVPVQADAQGCVTKTDCIDAGLDPEDSKPVVTIEVAASVEEARPPVRVYMGDDNGLDASSYRFTVNGGQNNTGVWQWNKSYTSAWIEPLVLLSAGNNTLWARICDSQGNCDEQSATVNYTAPAQAGRAPPQLRNVYDSERRNLATCDGCAEGVLTYSTPAYVSLDQERTVQLFYARGQGRPTGYVEVQATDNSTERPVKMSIRVVNPWGYVVGPETFYCTGDPCGGTPAANVRDFRLAAQWDASGYGTGAVVHTVTVRSYWADGGFHEAAIPIRVINLDERASRFGAGWTIVGLQRLYIQGDGVLLSNGDGSAVFFTKSGTSYTSPVGEVSTLTYDAAQTTYTRSFPDGRQTVFNATGLLQRLQDRFGATTAVQWTTNAEGVPVPHRIIDPAQQVVEFGYATLPGPHYGKLSWIRDPGGRLTQFGNWDGWDNLTAIEDPTGRGLNVTYDGPGHTLSGWTDQRGGRWDVGYDAYGRLARVHAPEVSNGSTSARATTSFRSHQLAVLPVPGTGTSAVPARRVVPDSAALVITSASGVGTRVLTDRFGLATVIEGAGERVEIVRDARGQTRWWADGKGNVVEIVYEDLRWHRVASINVTGPDGATFAAFKYGLYDQVTEIEEMERAPRNFVLGSRGEVLYAVRGADTLATYTYDERYRPRTFTDREGHVTTWTYDASGPQNARSVSAGGVTMEFRYDALGRAVRTLRNGLPGDSVAYDALNRVASATHAAGTTRFGYAGNGVDLAEVIDPLSQRYRFTHNVLGMVRDEIDPAGDTISYVYDPVTLRLERFTTRRGAAVSVRFDGEGRLVERTGDGVTTRWSYDPARRWMAAVAPASTDTAYSDSDGKLTQTVTYRGSLRFSIRHTYTQNNEPDSTIVTGPWGTRAYVYTYTSRGQLDGLKDYAGKWTTITLNREGLPETVRLPTTAGFQLTLGYTPAHALSFVNAPNGELSHTYGYDALGRLERDSIRTLGPVQHEYLYDELDRLTEWQLRGFRSTRVCSDPLNCELVWSDSLMQSRTFAWDAVGNPTDRGAVRDPGNRLRAYDGFTLSYDADGNLVYRYKAGVANDSLSWNSLGQLTRVRQLGGATIVYEYDALNRRIKRTNQGTGEVTHYIYDGGDLALEVDGAGNLLREYTYYPGIDAPHSMRQWAGGAGGAIYYYVLQQPGHVNGLVSAGGQLANKYRYTPFGTSASGYPAEGTPNPLQYMARELDPTTGLYYVRNRWYDPQQGRFLSEDPIGVAGGINLYAYAADNPLRNRDPLGLWPCPPGQLGLWMAYAGICDLGLKVLELITVEVSRRDDTQYAPPPASTSLGNVHPDGRGGFGIQPSVWSRATDVAEEVMQCALDHYNLGGVALRTGSWVGATPVDKAAHGIRVLPGASPRTNVISYIGYKYFPGLKSPVRLLGSNRVFGILGRANLVVAGGLAAYDIFSIGLCAVRREQ